ncbi:helix-turn-helix domain-containing protein [Crossiella sp. CA198]|uniref:helix-turn-helix domain-containing protein n=1 Tax=Crossiella sp. CA198 TaxID=3455607 RepID=UPI003F8D7276
MARPERPIHAAAGPVQRFALELRELRRQAGNPPYRLLAERARFSRAVLADAARGHRKPTLPVTLAYAKACGADPAVWATRWRLLTVELAQGPDLGASANTLAELRRGVDAFIVDFFTRRQVSARE